MKILLLVALTVLLHPVRLPAQGKARSAVLTGKATIVWESDLHLGTVQIPISANGTFYHILSLAKTQAFSLSHQNRKVELFLRPGDSLHIDFTQQSIVISGTAEKLNRALQEYEKKVWGNSSYLDHYNKMVFTLSQPRFLQQIDSLKKVDEKNLAAFVGAHPHLDGRMQRRLQQEIRYRHLFYQLLYPHNFYRHTRQRAAVAPDYFARLAKGSFDHPELLSSAPFVRYVNLYLDIQAMGPLQFQSLNSSPVERIHSRYQAIKKLRARPSVKDFFYGAHFTKAIGEYSTRDLAKTMDLFEKDCRDTAIQNRVRHLYQQSARQRSLPDTIQIYKRVGDIELEAHLFYPAGGPDPAARRPAYLFFHGGSWATGMPEWGYAHCRRYAGKGMVAISIEYRLQNVHGTTISDAVTDAMAAIAWVRSHADAFGIDPDRIVAAGFSSGAHLAACAALLPDSSSLRGGGQQPFSSKPNAVILQSAPYTVENRGALSPAVPADSYSPIANVRAGLPPMLLLHGEWDDIVRFSEFEQFVEKMKEAGNSFESKFFKSGHFFVDPAIIDTVNKMADDFLGRHGFIENKGN